MKELAKTYEASKYEKEIYQIWEKSGYFNPDNLKSKGKPFTISLPPPNATGILHLGHATMLAVQDLMVRFQRLGGRKVLWLPGTDHASIATQNVVEKKIWEEQKKTRFDIPREDFVRQVAEFAENSRGTIKNQMRCMGVSCDWSRDRYTLDAGLSQAVREAFVKLYKDDLIYRGKRIVNWCTRCGTTLADDEVEYKESVGKLYYIKYGPVTVATTRPETKLGDTALAVNTEDERYKHLVGKEFDVVLGKAKVHVKVIADKAIDKAFGTGVVGVTPAHSMADYELAQKYHLPLKIVISKNGTMAEEAGIYTGLKVKEAREKFVADLGEQIEKIEEYKHNLSICYRCSMPIEPMPLEQWFVAVDKPFKLNWFKKTTLKKLAIEAVKSGQIKIVPEKFNKVYYHWMENLHDWCISRQIWFGHRIPVWYRGKEIYCNTEAPEENTNFIFLHGFYRTLEIKDPLKWLYEHVPGSNNFWSLLPEHDKPNSKNAQIKFVLEKADINENTVIVTHSRGGKLAMKLLEENGRKIKGLVLIATGIGGGKIDVPDSGEYNDFDFEKIKSLVEKQIVLFEASEDHVRKPEAFQTLAQKLNARHIRAEKSASHYNQEEAPEILEEIKKFIWIQDPDTLDTWFSSSLWTFSTLGWPEQTKDLQTFHPTSVMETGYDILFFWVARMILMTKYILRQVPFRTVYLHGLVRDKQGKKMSKSLGNGIDPVAMIEKYGADALRLSMVIGNTPGNDFRLYEEKIAGYRNFVNKLWNICRYILLSVNNVRVIENVPESKTLADKWILSRFRQIIDLITNKIEGFQFSEAGEALYDFTWHELADWYLEVAKLEGDKDEILSYLLTQLLKLWHPYTPFITETLWQEAFGEKAGLLMVQKWPQSLPPQNNEAEKNFEVIKNIVISIRNYRSEKKLSSSQVINCSVSSSKHQELINQELHLISGLRTKVKMVDVPAEGWQKLEINDIALFFEE